jgi:hypothetical protein
MMFEPLLFHMTVSEKGWNRWSDSTSVLLLSILQDKRLRRDERVGAQRQVCQTQTPPLLRLLSRQILEELFASRFSYLASLQQFLAETHQHPRVSRTAHLKQYFELSELEGVNADAIERFNWMERLLPSAVTHKDALEATMKKAASNHRNPRKAAMLDETVLGWPIISSSSYPWLGVETKTRKRKYEIVAMAAIFEHILMQKYRPKLLKRTSIAHLRSSMAKTLQSHSKDGTWDFIDGLTADLSLISECEDMSSWVIEKPAPVDKNTAAIMKIIDMVQKSPVATSEGPNSMLDGHVSDALYHMVLVSPSLTMRRPQSMTLHDRPCS